MFLQMEALSQSGISIEREDQDTHIGVSLGLSKLQEGPHILYIYYVGSPQMSPILCGATGIVL